MTIDAILERLTYARKQAGLSQSQAGKLIGLSVGGFCDIEKGRNPLSVERFLQLCEIYDIDATWALTGINPRFDRTALMETVKKTTASIDEMHSILDLLESLRQDE